MTAAAPAAAPYTTVIGLEVHVQLQGPALAEPLLLGAADRFQRLTDWHLRRPAPPA